MIGERNLQALLQNTSPRRLGGTYVFCTVRDEPTMNGLKRKITPLGTFREREGLSLLITKEEADENELQYHGTFAGITLDVHSSLDAVGLTAVAASRLALRGISANVVAAFYHDHIFVQSHHASVAMDVLGSLAGHADAGSIFLNRITPAVLSQGERDALLMPADLIGRLPDLTRSRLKFDAAANGVPGTIVPAPKTHVGAETASFNGTAQKFIDAKLQELRQNSPELVELFQMQMKNKVRVCPMCGKSCGVVMVACNGCGHDISKEKVALTLNIFACFVFGVAKLPKRPLSLYIRKETKNMIVMDDMNSMSAVHLCAVFTGAYIPHVHYLFEHPGEGLKLCNEMMASATGVVKSQFLSLPNLRSAAGRVGEQQPRTVEQICKSDLLLVFNSPPSQFQLHLQTILAPTIADTLRNDCLAHFKPGRCFPADYVAACLKKMVEMGETLPNARDMLSTDIIGYSSQILKVQYKEYIGTLFSRLYEAFENSNYYATDDKYEYAIYHKENDRVVRIDGDRQSPVSLEPNLKRKFESWDKHCKHNFGPRRDLRISRAMGNSETDSQDDGARYYSFAKTAPLPVWMEGIK